MNDRPASIANWLPLALREAPEGVPGAPRLLDALLAAVDGQRRLLEGDIDQVWDDLFIESCQDWAVPYLAAIVGLPPDAERREIASAVALRRRKGTPAALEDFAEVLTGWTARVVEGWQVSLWAHRLGHPLPTTTAALDLRDPARYRVGTPFERARRSVAPSRRWSPRSVAAVVWPWQVRTLRGTEAAPIAPPDATPTTARRFALHPLGVDAPPYLRPRPARLEEAAGPAALARRTGDETDAPVRATYQVIQALAAPGDIDYGTNWTVSARHPLAGGEPGQPVLLQLRAEQGPIGWDSIRFGSLPLGLDAPAPPGPGEVVVDVVRGAVELGEGLDGPLRATWHRPVPGSLGALAADADADPAARVVVVVDPDAPAAGTPGGNVVATLADALQLAEQRAVERDLAAEDSTPAHPDVEIRLNTSRRLEAPPPTAFTPRLPRWRIVAPRLMIPTVVGDLSLNLAAACLALEGFYLTGDLLLGPGLAGAELVNLTMDPSGQRTVAVDPAAWGIELAARRCILGALRADLGALPVRLVDCIVDGRGLALRLCGDDPGGADRAAVAAVTPAGLGPELDADGVTFVGAVRAESVDAVDCLFLDGVAVVQQQGCLRNCFLGTDPDSEPSLPPIFRCLREPPPVFAAEAFEAAGYYSLALDPDQPLLSAASDGGEVGAYHHARRGTAFLRLRRRLHEFVPLGLRPVLELAPWEE